MSTTPPAPPPGPPSAPPPGPPSAPPPAGAPGAAPPKRGGGNIWLILFIVAGVLFVGALIFAVISFTGKSSAEDDKDKAQKELTSTKKQLTSTKDELGTTKGAGAILGDLVRTGAKSADDLHSANNNLTKQTALSEKGEVINGRGDTPNRHDAITGSQPDGRAFTGTEDRTCGNYTKSSGAGAVMLGHIDRIGLRDDDASKSWNSSHPSRGPDGGCSQADLKSTGGDGLIYCFAAN